MSDFKHQTRPEILQRFLRLLSAPKKNLVLKAVTSTMANKLLPDKPPKVILELLITLLQLILSRLDIFRKLVATGGQYLTAGL
ncbi:hypothetical protein JSY31_19755 [Xenorhabdus bovienii]|nr:hypothetical protein [Xenorhabdus bovienii]